MAQKNTSDLIEAYIKQILETSETIEIRRAEMASLFNCVPSQINYVINTRFTVHRGYIVESKRGGGGYIRIEKVQLATYHQFLEHVADLIGEELTEKDAQAILQKLYEEGILTNREGNLLLSSFSKQALGSLETENQLRASMLMAVLERLSYEDRK